MEMSAENLAKYRAKHGSPVPKSGRYAPHGQHFQCSTQEQIDTLEAAGWSDSPIGFGYKPEEAITVEQWDDVTLESSVRTLKPREKTPKEKLAELLAREQAAQAPAVDVAALQKQLAAVTAKLEALESQAQAPKVGRPRKAAA